MSKVDLTRLSNEQLVARFVEHCLTQDDALYGGPVEIFNQHFRAMRAIKDELRSRPGDQRTALLPLYEHENLQVRLQAAKVSFAVAPTAARAVIEAIASSKHYPYAGAAGMTLWALDDGIFKPS